MNIIGHRYQDLTVDPFFSIDILDHSSDPERTAWWGMHQCYSETPIDMKMANPTFNYGGAAVKHLLAGDRGHYSPLEHNSITFGVAYFPHSVMQQYRTHRVGISFSVQSLRYTGRRVVNYAEGFIPFEQVFYVPQPGVYHVRDGMLEIKEEDTKAMRDAVHSSAIAYAQLAKKHDIPADRARYVLPYAVRQHFVMTVNARSLMHLLDLRHKPDAELESQTLAKLLMEAFTDWMPEVAQWYANRRLNKGKLAP